MVKYNVSAIISTYAKHKLKKLVTVGLCNFCSTSLVMANVHFCCGSQTSCFDSERSALQPSRLSVKLSFEEQVSIIYLVV